MNTILLIILVLVFAGALPNWNHSANWGYGPSGLIGILVLLMILRVFGFI